MPYESSKAWRAFCTYRDLGPKRTVIQTAKDLGITRSTISAWTVKYMWEERARAFDDYLDRRIIEATVEEKVKMHRRHVALGLRVQQKASERLSEIQAQELSPRDVLDWVRTGVSIERDARGVNEPVPVNTNVNVDAKSPEDAADIIAALRNSVENRIGTGDDLE